MQNEKTLFKKHVVKGRKGYKLEYIILECENYYGIKIKSTINKIVESKAIFPIGISKDETLKFIVKLSSNLVFPISLKDIYEDFYL
jgi:hypothetical protein